MSHFSQLLFALFYHFNIRAVLKPPWSAFLINGHFFSFTVASEPHSIVLLTFECIFTFTISISHNLRAFTAERERERETVNLHLKWRVRGERSGCGCGGGEEAKNCVNWVTKSGQKKKVEKKRKEKKKDLKCQVNKIQFKWYLFSYHIFAQFVYWEGFLGWLTARLMSKRHVVVVGGSRERERECLLLARWKAAMSHKH